MNNLKFTSADGKKLEGEKKSDAKRKWRAIYKDNKNYIDK
jgi:hypothetical protein